MKFAPGAPSVRSEDQRLLTGKGQFADDLIFDNQAYMTIVRSPHAHAKILSIDPSAALDMPGVLAVLTAEDWDADGLGGFPAVIEWTPEPLKLPDGTPFTHGLNKPLQKDRVRFVGEPVAVVIAETPTQAADAVEAVYVDYEELPAATNSATCMEDGQPLVREDIPNNTFFVYNFGDEAATEEAFKTAPNVVTQRKFNNRVHANPMEPRSVNATYDAEGEHYTVFGGIQNAFLLRTFLATLVFNTTEDKVDVVPGDLGGSFGLKSSITAAIGLCPWAAKRIGRPVKWTATRTEMITADNHARDVLSDAALAFDNEGKFLALRSHQIANHGAFLELFGVASCLDNVGGTVGTYTIPTAHVQVKGVFSHSSPVAPYRGAGRPEASYIIENLIDEAAAKLGMDPVEIRRKNLIPSSAMPYKTALTFTYDCGEFEQVLDKAVNAADYKGFETRRQASEVNGKLRGIGVAMCIETSIGPGPEFAELRFTADGKAQVLAGSTNHGQGHEGTFIQFLAHNLGVPHEAISVVESDTRIVKAGVGTGASRSAALNAAAIGDAITKVIEQGKPIAARLLQTSEDKVSFADQNYEVEGSDQKIAFMEVVKESFSDGGEGLGAMGEFNSPAAAFTNGCQVSEVEIDPSTGKVSLISHTICDDLGFEINPLLVRGQLIGGMAQGAGQVLMEDMVIDENGQVLTGSFMDYAMPRATDLINVQTLGHMVPTALNPYGIKGVGESGTVGSLPAIMLAINNALASTGAEPVQMPATPQKIWHALNKAKSKVA